VNEKNLIPLTKRELREHKKIASNGGKNSGKKRKKLKSFREAITELLTLPPPERTDCEKLKEFGLEETNQMLAIVAFFEGLLGKNKTCADSYKLLLDILGENKSTSLENSESFKNLIEAIRNV
jgi:hypothetical protein